MSPSTTASASILSLPLVLLLLTPTTLAQVDDDVQIDDPQTPDSTQNTCLLVAPTTTIEFSETYDPIRISPALTCASDASGPCPLQSWAYVSYATRLNVSTPDGDAQRDALLNRLVGGFANEPVLLAKDGVEGVVANETFFVEQGESAYVEFVAEGSCRVWYVDGCNGLLADYDAQYIEACYPVYNTDNGTLRKFSGEKTLVRVDAETARGMTDHPFAGDDAGLGPDEPCTAANSMEGCGAVGDPEGSEGEGSDANGDGAEQQQGNGVGAVGVSVFATGAAVLVVVFGLL